MEAHIAPKPSVPVNKIASLCEIYGGPYDTQYCMENLEQAFVDYASLRNNGMGGEENRNPSSPKRVHFVKSITIVSGNDKTKEDESQTSEIEKKEKSSDIKKGNKGRNIEDKACKIEPNIGEEEEWMEYEQPLDLVYNAQGDSETDKEESVEAMNPTPLATKYNIVVNWKIFQQGQRSIYQIMRANGADTVYTSFRAMIKEFTREDLIELYRFLVYYKSNRTNRPEDAYDKVLWSDLKTMFDPPLNEDAIWSLPLQQKMVS
ncbi:hypothetical protein Tco_1318594 [Tanacetum coccineum]